MAFLASTACGTSGAPTTPSISCTSARDGAAPSRLRPCSILARTHDFTAPPPPPRRPRRRGASRWSSGTGTSSTVSRPSSRSRVKWQQQCRGDMRFDR
uniref:Uncharacterized protein n=1 Tax=Oryza glumipatula TaxID=40148 RepID=A0A0D9ZW98_9ORYZ